LLFERDEDNDDDDGKEDVEKEDLRCSYFGDIDAHERVLAGAVSAFTQAA
jgi:hypothetical protein